VAGQISNEDLVAKVSELATELDVPGAAVGIVHDGVEHYAFHGVTSTKNPLPVDETTLFQFGSTGKTYTATAIMRLMERGDLDLDQPVRTYLPEFALQDEDVAREATVLNLLNHTAGWEGDLSDNTGDGDDALERYVALMKDIRQVTPLNATVSYNNASLSVAGRIIEKLTGKTYEAGMRELVLDPLGLDDTLFFMTEIMMRRFAVGHVQEDDGSIHLAPSWAIPRGNAPAGGMSATAADQLRWARFHLGDGTAADGSRVLSAESVARMQQPTVSMPGSALGDHVGISWLLRDVDGVRVVAHGGTTIGQHSEFLLVPERDFGLISLTNCGPNGPKFNDRLRMWAFEQYLGVIEREPVPVQLSNDELAQYVGTYETIILLVDVAPADGGLVARITVKPEMAQTLRDAGQDPDEPQPDFPIGLLGGDGDRYVISHGAAEGMKGYFTRGADGAVDGIHLGGRLATRVGAKPDPVGAPA
jgi:CubicO group peptidase (beta-lactamase class C family)